MRGSSDSGRTGELREKTDLIWPSAFVYGDALDMIGTRRKTREVLISRSVDGGYRWEPEVEVWNRRSSGAPTPVTFQDGHVYRAFETCPVTGRSGGGRSSWDSFVMAGDLSKDLLDPSAWSASSTLPFPGTPPRMNTRAYPPETGTEDCWVENGLSVWPLCE